jgi:hypothetical protein
MSCGAVTSADDASFAGRCYLARYVWTMISALDSTRQPICWAAARSVRRKRMRAPEFDGPATPAVSPP